MRGGVVMQYAVGGRHLILRVRRGVYGLNGRRGYYANAGGGGRYLILMVGRGAIWFKWEEGLLCNAGRGGDIWYKEGGFVKQGIRYLI